MLKQQYGKKLLLKKYDLKRKIFNEEVKKIISIFLIFKMLIWMAAFIGSYIIPIYEIQWDPNIYTHNLFLQLWTRWDGGWYLRVAKFGYFTPKFESNIRTYNIFPLYPFFIRILAIIVKDFALSGFLISNVMTFVAVFYLYKLVKLDFNIKIATSSIFYFLIFPSAFYLSAVYSESLFAALTIAAFYYARKKNWLTSGILGFLSSMTRPMGVLTFIPLAYEYFKQNKIENKQIIKIRKSFLYLFLIPLGIILVIIYFWFLSGDILVYVHALSSPEWSIHLTLPWINIINDFIFILNNENLFYASLVLLSYIFLIVFIVSCFYSKKYLRCSYIIFMIINILLILILSSTIQFFYRFALPLFPFYISLGIFTVKHKNISLLISGIFLTILFTLTMLFVTWYWIT